MSDHMPQSSEIDALLSEDRRFEPTPAFRAAANVNDPEVYPEHDLFIQLMKLKNTLRYLKGEELITHLGREYYD